MIHFTIFTIFTHFYSFFTHFLLIFTHFLLIFTHFYSFLLIFTKFYNNNNNNSSSKGGAAKRGDTNGTARNNVVPGGNIAKAVAIGVGVLKIFNPLTIVKMCADAVSERVSRVVSSPSDRRLWTLDTTMDREFDAKIGRFRGGLQLMAAFGFVDPSTAQVTSIASTRTPGKLTLRNTTEQ